MKNIRCIIDISMVTGEYEMSFENVDNPGEPMDYFLLQEAVEKVLADWRRQVEEPNLTVPVGVLKVN